MSGFQDHFASVADHYVASRPSYPVALFAWLAEQCPQRILAWDCGTGSGQAALALTDHFTQVWATDGSAAQIAQAIAHPQITYRQSVAEQSGLPGATVDLVVVAQALHWFALEPFYQEVRRVLKPQGLLAVWSYGRLLLEDAAVNAQVQTFYHALHDYWPPERCHVESGYQTLPFPFAQRPAPPFAMSLSWNLPHLLRYLRSWSAVGRYQQEQGNDPVTALTPHLQACWGDPERTITINWPLALRVGGLT
ncbi:MAG: class I SAM-dependent methyltransferase [Magnetococcales bacterium]|nr:class I SAM-dependent methyltransferase [Magnetococcales bacterium]